MFAEFSVALFTSREPRYEIRTVDEIKNSPLPPKATAPALLKGRLAEGNRSNVMIGIRPRSSSPHFIAPVVCAQTPCVPWSKLARDLAREYKRRTIAGQFSVRPTAGY